MDFSIWVDGDSCPVAVRDLIIRFALRLQITTYFVANRVIPIPKRPSLFKMIVTETAEGAADDYIVLHIQHNDLAITRDIPLASRLLDKGITVINDRGTAFSPESIREKLSIRNFNYELAQLGIKSDNINRFDKRDLNNFANCLDKILQSKIRNTHLS